MPATNNGDRPTITIPLPLVRPLGIPVNRDAVREVWNEFVLDKNGEMPMQSIEERVLTAILRAVYEGLPPTDAEPDENKE